jgi:hypothetical protein
MQPWKKHHPELVPFAQNLRLRPRPHSGCADYWYLSIAMSALVLAGITATRHSSLNSLLPSSLVNPITPYSLQASGFGFVAILATPIWFGPLARAVCVCVCASLLASFSVLIHLTIYLALACACCTRRLFVLQTRRAWTLHTSRSRKFALLFSPRSP